MPMPLFMSQILPSATDVIAGGGGSSQAVPLTAYYFLVTHKTSAGNGKSFCKQLSELLTASDTGVTWTVVLTSAFKLKFTHNSGSTRSVTSDINLGWKLGGDAGPVEPVATGTLGFALATVPPGAGGATLPYPPVWLWNPNGVVGGTGPDLFDPAFEAGIKSSAGATARAPDGTSAFVSIGTQIDASFFFSMVENYYRSHPAVETGAVHQREDLVTWWYHGPKQGRRVLFWRDQTAVVGTTAPAAPAGGAYPKPYVEYFPAESLRSKPPLKATSPPNTRLFDVTLDFHVTERGEFAIYT